jgi:hypothetical protein
MAQLGDNALKTGLARLRFLVEQVADEEELGLIPLTELFRNQPAQPGEGLEPLKALCNKKIEDQWLAALIFTAEPRDPHERVGYRYMAGSVLLATIALEHKNSEYLAQAERACRQVRLLAGPKESGLLTQFKAAETVEKVYDFVCKQENQSSGKLAGRFATLRVLLDRYQSGAKPIRRAPGTGASAGRKTRDRENQEGSEGLSATSSLIEAVYTQEAATLTEPSGEPAPRAAGPSQSGEAGERPRLLYVPKQAPLGEWSEDLSRPPIVREQAPFESLHDPVENPEMPPVRQEVDFQGEGGTREDGRQMSAFRRTTWLTSGAAKQLGSLCQFGIMPPEVERLCQLGLEAGRNLENQTLQGRFIVLLCALIGTTAAVLVPAVLRLAPVRTSQGPGPDQPPALVLTDDGTYIAFSRPQSKLRAIAGKAEVLVGAAPSILELQLPDFMRGPILKLADALAKRGVTSGEIGQALAAMSFRETRSISETDVQCLLRNTLRRAGLDEAVCGHITGDDPQTVTAMHYASLEAGQIQEAYNVALSELLKQPVSTPARFSEARIGSPVAVKNAKIQRLYESMHEMLAAEKSDLSPEGIAGFHNMYVSFVTGSLSLMTGYRPVRNPFEQRVDFDPRRRLLYICDKRLRTTAGDRYIPVPEKFVEQFEALKRHLEVLAVTPPFNRPAISDACKNALADSGPLLFMINEEGTGRGISVMRPALQKETFGSDEVWPLPLNWGRHVMRTRFVGLRKELSNAFMGHANPGAEPFANHSAMSMVDLEELRKQLDEACEYMGVIVLEGLR